MSASCLPEGETKVDAEKVNLASESYLPEGEIWIDSH